MRRTGPLANQQPDKLCGSCRIAKNSGPYKVLKLFFDCHSFLPFEKDMILLEKQTGLQKLQITNWFTEQIQQVNIKSEDPTKGQKILKRKSWDLQFFQKRAINFCPSL